MTRSSIEELLVYIDGLVTLKINACCSQLDLSLTFGQLFVFG
jgi:hypothetical protein